MDHWLLILNLLVLAVCASTLGLVVRLYREGQARLTASVRMVGGRRMWTRELDVIIRNTGGRAVYPATLRAALPRRRASLPLRTTCLADVIEAGNQGTIRFEASPLARLLQEKGYRGKVKTTLLLIDRNDRPYRLCTLEVDVRAWAT